MRLFSICLVSDHVPDLRGFYEQVLCREATSYGDQYVEFRLEGGVLALFDAAAQERLAPGAMVPRANRSAMLEIEVEDVDGEYGRLRARGVDFVKLPSTQPWGNRSFYFRDPDGNVVNFFTRVNRPAR